MNGRAEKEQRKGHKATESQSVVEITTPNALYILNSHKLHITLSSF